METALARSAAVMGSSCQTTLLLQLEMCGTIVASGFSPVLCSACTENNIARPAVTSRDEMKDNLMNKLVPILPCVWMVFPLDVGRPGVAQDAVQYPHLCARCPGGSSRCQTAGPAPTEDYASCRPRGDTTLFDHLGEVTPDPRDLNTTRSDRVGPAKPSSCGGVHLRCRAS